MSKPTLLGAMMKQVRYQRDQARSVGMANIMRRNNIKMADVGTNGFLLKESTVVAENGSESLQYQLFKLVDQENIVIELDIKRTNESGIGAKTDDVHRGTQNKDVGASI